MTNPKARRITRELTPAEREQVARHRQKISAELPDLIERDRMRGKPHEATLSGKLAVHRSEHSLGTIAACVGITPLDLDEFLTGERTLRSDVIDRLAAALGYALQSKDRAVCCLQIQ